MALTRMTVVACGIASASCGMGARIVPFAQSDSSCTRTTWWIEAPRSLVVGEESTLHIRRCEGRAAPMAFTWQTSSPLIIGIVSTESNYVLVKALGEGKASITARSKRPLPPARSSVTITVHSGRAVGAEQIIQRR